jgi:hypothetical protein
LKNYEALLLLSRCERERCFDLDNGEVVNSGEEDADAESLSEAVLGMLTSRGNKEFDEP